MRFGRLATLALAGFGVRLEAGGKLREEGALGAVAFAFRAELRSRWRSWLAIALLIAVVGGFVLAATAAGRRTSSAYPRFVSTYGYDATVFATRKSRSSIICRRCPPLPPW